MQKELIHSDSLALAGDGTPVVTSRRERKKRICDCKQKGILGCKCNRYFSRPHCDIGWDSSRDYFYHGYDLYMLVDSQSDLPVFPHYSCASRHDSHGFLHAFFRMKAFLPDYSVSKVLLDSAHDCTTRSYLTLTMELTFSIDHNIYLSKYTASFCQHNYSKFREIFLINSYDLLKHFFTCPIPLLDIGHIEPFSIIIILSLKFTSFIFLLFTRYDL